MPEGSLYYKPTEHWKDDTQKSTSLESEGTVQDQVKLISTELEKRIKHIGADSPSRRQLELLGVKLALRSLINSGTLL